jgi:hypothetical protein
MRVLPVAQDVRARPGGAHPARPARAGTGVGEHAAHPGGDLNVVGGSVRECLGGEQAPLGQGEPTTANSGEDVGIVLGRHHDCDARVVLRGRPDHRRPADVNLLDALVGRRSGAHRLGERVQVSDDEVEAAIPSSSSWSTCDWRRLSARIPACTRGCSVLTRPSRHSGNPVTSSTAVTGTPAAATAAAVDPVDTMATPASCRPAASGSSPVLS